MKAQDPLQRSRLPGPKGGRRWIISVSTWVAETAKCVSRNSAGEIIEEARRATIGLGPRLAGRNPARVVFETSTGAFRLASMAQQHGHDVRVVAATLVRSLGVGQRGLKNDVRCARILSEASSRKVLPSVHIPTVISHEVKVICVSRESLIRMRTQFVNQVRSYVMTTSAIGWS